MFSCTFYSNCSIKNSSGYDLEVVIDNKVTPIYSGEEKIFTFQNDFAFTFKSISSYGLLRLEECGGDYCFFYVLNGCSSGSNTVAIHVTSFTGTSSSNNGYYNPDGASVQCRAYTTDGTRCKRMTTNRDGYCWQH